MDEQMILDNQSRMYIIEKVRLFCGEARLRMESSSDDMVLGRLLNIGDYGPCLALEFEELAIALLDYSSLTFMDCALEMILPSEGKIITIRRAPLRMVFMKDETRERLSTQHEGFLVGRNYFAFDAQEALDQFNAQAGFSLSIDEVSINLI